MREIRTLHLEGVTTVGASQLAERLWPNGRHQNSQGQVFHLGAAVAARLLRCCPAVREREPRRWEILPHRIEPLEGGEVQSSPSPTNPTPHQNPPAAEEPIRTALERAARELELIAAVLIQAGWNTVGSRAQNEARAARKALAHAAVAQLLAPRLARQAPQTEATTLLDDGQSQPVS